MESILKLVATALLVVGCSTAPTPETPATLDFGDYTSQTLTTNAWLALADGNYDHVLKYTEKCIELYEKEAKVMQASLDARPPAAKVHDYWALNDVGTSYFIQGEALSKLGQKNEAINSYKVVRDELFHAQTWDPKGWFWSPSTASYTRIEALRGDF